MYRNTYIEIDTDVIKNNVKNIISSFGGYKYYIGVVKGNAYGYGDYITKYIVSEGINYLAVSSLEEGISIREYVDTPILCLEPIPIKYVDVAINNNITLCVSSYDYFLDLKKLDKSVKFHLKLNTGMNRLGIKDKDIVTKIFNECMDNNKLNMEGIFSHLATSGVYDIYYKKQVDMFRYLVSDIDLSKVEIVHLGRSCTLDFYPKIDICNGVRIGIMMFGVESTFPSFNGLKGKIRKIKFDYFRKKNELPKLNDKRLVNVSGGLSLYSEIIDIQKVSKGEIVGYGSNTIMKNDGYIGVIPLGYADGMSTKYSDSYVIINNKKYMVIGSINMGMMTILIDDSVKIGDKVIVVDKNISYKEYGSKYKVGPYVFLTSLRQEIPRRYMVAGKVDKVVDINE